MATDFTTQADHMACAPHKDATPDIADALLERDRIPESVRATWVVRTDVDMLNEAPRMCLQVRAPYFTMLAL